MHPRRLGLAALCLGFVVHGLCLSAVAGEVAGDEAAADARIHAAFDEERRIATLTIQTPDGRLHWNDLLRGIARVRGFDDEALLGLLPGGSVDLDHFTVRLSLVALDNALGEDYRLDLAFEGNSARRLVVRIDEQALLESQRRLKKRLRQATAGWWRSVTGSDAPTRGLRPPKDWDPEARGGRWVVFVHGLDSDAAHREDYLEDLRERGFAVGTFAYRNDASIAEAGGKLAAELSTLAEDHPGVRVSLVTWSMGGLVARYALETPDLDPGNVDRLIMVGPPNHGSQLARFAFALDVAEHLGNLDGGGPADRLFAAIEDGLGEAWVDLQPDSSLLRTLNEQKRNPGVRYSILLGTAAPLTREQLTLLRHRFQQAGEDNRFVRFLGPKVDRWLAEMDEVVHGRGDGAVAVERGRLEGVEDVVLLPFDHLTALHGPGEAGVEARLRNEIEKRLRAEP